MSLPRYPTREANQVKDVSGALSRRRKLLASSAVAVFALLIGFLVYQRQAPGRTSVRILPPSEWTLTLTATVNNPGVTGICSTSKTIGPFQITTHYGGPY